MSPKEKAKDQEELTIELEFVPADERLPDPATESDVALSAVDALRREGYTVQSAYTGAKGGELFEVFRHLGTGFQDHETLVRALLQVVRILAGHVSRHRDKLMTPTQGDDEPDIVRIDITIDGASISVRAADAETAAQLADRFRTAQPQVVAQLRPQSSVKVKALVKANPPHPRRPHRS